MTDLTDFQRKRQEKMEKARNLYAAGMSARNISHVLKVTPQTVTTWVKPSDVKVRPAWDSNSMYDWLTYGNGKKRQ